MKRLLILPALLAAAQITSAQSFLLCGRITDSKGKPVQDATLQAISKDSLLLATSDAGGLYATTQLPAGRYEVVIRKDKKSYVTLVDIAPTDPVKRFYNFTLADNNKATLAKTDKDPYMETAFAKLKRAPRVDAKGDVYIMPIKKGDSTTKARSK